MLTLALLHFTNLNIGCLRRIASIKPHIQIKLHSGTQQILVVFEVWKCGKVSAGQRVAYWVLHDTITVF